MSERWNVLISGFCRHWVLTAVAAICLGGSWAHAVTSVDEEFGELRQWADAHVASGNVVPAFSFTCEGRAFDYAAAARSFSEKPAAQGSACVERRTIWTDAELGLEVRCESQVYSDYPVAEWVVFVRNVGREPSPLIENLKALDVVQPRSAGDSVTVHHARGSNAEFADFEPLSDALPTGGHLSLGSHGRPGNRVGVPSVEAMPFFNVAGADGGLIVGLGWTGPWMASCERKADGAVSLQAGFEPMHIRLEPGEEIRLPRVALLFWKGDRLRAQNLWRGYVRAHFSPTPGGKPFEGLIADANWGSWMSADRHIDEIRWWRNHDLPMECYWVDAGWTDMSLGWEAHQSQQEPNRALFPEGMKPLSDAAHANGMKLLLWMVPPSVHPAVGIGKEHPEWLGEPYGDPSLGAMVFHGLDHGDPNVNLHMIDHFSDVVVRFGVDIFRQDGGNLWPMDTEPGRVGMHQIRYVQGAISFWDGLLQRHPGLLIDNCAEGGRKIDLEAIKRSIVLWRSDSQASGEFDAISNQGFTYGLLSWIPLCGAAVPVHHLSKYAFRSAYAPALLMCWPMAQVSDIQDRWKDIDLDLLRKLLKEYVALRPNLFGDFYPLTAYSRDAHAWMAWQCDRSDLGQGMVQVFRRAECADASQVYRLHALNPDDMYSVTNVDDGQSKKVYGKTLMDEGLSVAISEQPGAAIIAYRRCEP